MFGAARTNKRKNQALSFLLAPKTGWTARPPCAKLREPPLRQPMIQDTNNRLHTIYSATRTILPPPHVAFRIDGAKVSTAKPMKQLHCFVEMAFLLLAGCSAQEAPETAAWSPPQEVARSSDSLSTS